MASKHEHVWTWKPWYEVRKFVCIAKDCHAILTTAEAEQRLNAYDKLVTERDLLLRALGINDPSRIAEVLPATALEGE